MTPAVAPSSSDAMDLDALATFQAASPRPGWRTRHRWVLLLALEVTLLLAAWELVVSGLGWIRPAFLPPPSAIGVAFIETIGGLDFLDHLWFSLGNLVIGVALAIVIGVPVGLAAGWSRILDVTVTPVLWTIYAVPKVAFAPLMILALGLGSASKVALVFLLGVFPIALNTLEGVRTVDPSLIRAARVFGAPERRVVRRVVLPASLPLVLVGVRRAIGLGFIGAMLGEFLGGSKGIGHLLNHAAHDFHMAEALALVVIMVIVVNGGLVALGILQRRLAPWVT